MRPPGQRNFVGIASQVRPKFGTASGPTPAPVQTFFAPENTDSMLKQACQQPYGKQALPLIPVNQFRNKDPVGDHSRHPPQPKLPRRPNVKAPILVKTFD